MWHYVPNPDLWNWPILTVNYGKEPWAYQMRPRMSLSLQSTMSVESMLTSVTPSRSRNWSAIETFSSFWDRKLGFLLCFGIRLPERTSISEISFNPSDSSVSRLEIWNRN